MCASPVRNAARSLARAEPEVVILILTLLQPLREAEARALFVGAIQRAIANAEGLQAPLE